MAEKHLNRSNVMTVVCAAILVGTEILAAALALGWAAGGLMDWGNEFTYALIAICLGIGVYAIAKFVSAAVKVEPFYD
ncbi:hypothetical protein MCEMSEM23_01600 [Rhabdaerophilaceae bacterium]